MEIIYYIVKKIDGDYAYLQRDDMMDLEPKIVARALLPYDIMENNKLKYEMYQYEII